jgi:hypothetical protein
MIMHTVKYFTRHPVGVGRYNTATPPVGEKRDIYSSFYFFLKIRKKRNNIFEEEQKQKGTKMPYTEVELLETLDYCLWPVTAPFTFSRASAAPCRTPRAPYQESRRRPP